MTTIIYTCEGQECPVTYNLLSHPPRLAMNDNGAFIPDNWNTMTEEDKCDWLGDSEFYNPHDENLCDEIAGGYANVIASFVGGVLDTLISNPNKLNKLHNSIYDFDTSTITLSDGTKYNVPSTGIECGIFNMETILN